MHFWVFADRPPSCNAVPEVNIFTFLPAPIDLSDHLRLLESDLMYFAYRWFYSTTNVNLKLQPCSKPSICICIDSRARYKNWLHSNLQKAYSTKTCIIMIAFTTLTLVYLVCTWPTTNTSWISRRRLERRVRTRVITLALTPLSPSIVWTLTQLNQVHW